MAGKRVNLITLKMVLILISPVMVSSNSFEWGIFHVVRHYGSLKNLVKHDETIYFSSFIYIYRLHQLRSFRILLQRNLYNPTLIGIRKLCRISKDVGLLR